MILTVTLQWDAAQFAVLKQIFGPPNPAKLDQILTLLQALKTQGDSNMATLDEVLADVADEKTRIDSLSALVAGLKKQLDDVLAGNLTPEVQAKVDAIFAAVEVNKAEVQAAIDANTPAG